MEIYVNIYLIAIFSLFSGLSHDLIIYIDFTHIAASNTASVVRHKVGHT